MLNAIRYAREKQVPYFGICLGMQTACIEFARNVCGLKDANSSEFDPASAAPHHLQAARTAGRGRDGRDDAAGRVDLRAAAGFAGGKGLWRSDGDQRAAPAPVRVQSRVRGAADRRRAAASAGTTPDSTYVEIVEIPGHPYFLGCQFHPEFKSKPLEPHPLFREFVTASYRNRLERMEDGRKVASETTVRAFVS